MGGTVSTTAETNDVTCRRTPFPPPNNTVQYTFDFIFDIDIWAAPHIVNPFTLYLFSRSTCFTFLVVGVFEIFEILAVTIFRNYVIFFVTEADDDETISSSILGDWLFQGGIGILIGWLFVWVVGAPKPWMPNWYRENGLWWKYFFFYVLYNAPIPLFGWVIDPFCERIPIGALITVATHTAIILLFYAKLNWKQDDWDEIWWNLSINNYHRTYLGWLIVNNFILYSVFYHWAWSTYIQTWIASAIVIAALLLYALLLQNRYSELQWAFNYYVFFMKKRKVALDEKSKRYHNGTYKKNRQLDC